MSTWVGWIHDELNDPGAFGKRLTEALVAALPKAGATPLTYDDVERAVRVALKAQAAIVAKS
jgi:hypothetical protein